MKKLFSIFYLLLFVNNTACSACQSHVKTFGKLKPVIVKIEITDKTYIHYCMNGKTTKKTIIVDQSDLRHFQIELDSMKEVHDVNIRYSVGYYDMVFYFDDGTRQQTGLIYTIYDGVVFQNYETNQSFKNNEMEVLVRGYFSVSSF